MSLKPEKVLKEKYQEVHGWLVQNLNMSQDYAKSYLVDVVNKLKQPKEELVKAFPALFESPKEEAEVKKEAKPKKETKSKKEAKPKAEVSEVKPSEDEVEDVVEVVEVEGDAK